MISFLLYCLSFRIRLPISLSSLISGAGIDEDVSSTNISLLWSSYLTNSRALSFFPSPPPIQSGQFNWCFLPKIPLPIPQEPSPVYILLPVYQ